ncbi:hypothetical protein CY34DRAFT_491026, partial [Suillus luteus UH-Slu-Lm8-n1]
VDVVCSRCKELVDKGVQNALIKITVNSSSVDCLISVLRASQGMFAGSTFARPLATTLSQVSMVPKAEAISESLKS